MQGFHRAKFPYFIQVDHERAARRAPAPGDGATREARVRWRLAIGCRGLLAGAVSVVALASPVHAYQTRIIELPLLANQWASALAVADVTGDGHLDLVVGFVDAYLGTGGFSPVSGGLMVFSGDGRGDAREVGAISVDRGASSLAVADFNGDGVADIAASNGCGGCGTYDVVLVSAAGGRLVRLRGASGRDGPPGENPFALVPGDFDGDAAVDLFALGNRTFGFLGDGTGRLAPWPSAPRVTALSIAGGDLDGHAPTDLVFTRYWEPPSHGSVRSAVVTRLATGDGHFAATTIPFPLHQILFERSPALADLNADGRLDIISTTFTEGSIRHRRNRDRHTVWVQRNRGGGRFGAPVAAWRELRGGVLAIAIGDLDQDDRPDAILLTESPGERQALAWLAGDGHGGFTSRADLYITPRWPSLTSMSVGDLDEDGRGDVVALPAGEASHSLLVFTDLAASIVMPFADAPATAREHASVPVTVELHEPSVVTIRLESSDGHVLRLARTPLPAGRSVLNVIVRRPPSRTTHSDYQLWVHANAGTQTNTKRLPIEIS